MDMNDALAPMREMMAINQARQAGGSYGNMPITPGGRAETPTGDRMSFSAGRADPFDGDGFRSHIRSMTVGSMPTTPQGTAGMDRPNHFRSMSVLGSSPMSRRTRSISMQDKYGLGIGRPLQRGMTKRHARRVSKLPDNVDIEMVAQKIRAMLALGDVDDDGRVDKDEFMMLFPTVYPECSEETLDSIFQALAGNEESINVEMLKNMSNEELVNKFLEEELFEENLEGVERLDRFATALFEFAPTTPIDDTTPFPPDSGAQSQMSSVPHSRTHSRSVSTMGDTKFMQTAQAEEQDMLMKLEENLRVLKTDEYNLKQSFSVWIDRLGETDQEIKDAFDTVDHDGNGHIEFEEFEIAMSKLHINGDPSTPDRTIREMFEEIDKDDSGHIDFQEFRGFVIKVKGLDQKAQAEEVDANVNNADVLKWKETAATLQEELRQHKSAIEMDELQTEFTLTRLQQLEEQNQKLKEQLAGNFDGVFADDDAFTEELKGELSKIEEELVEEEEIRASWNVGSKVEVFSAGLDDWFRGEIVNCHG